MWSQTQAVASTRIAGFVRPGWRRWYRPTAIGLTVLIALFGAYQLWIGLAVLDWRQAIGSDVRLYVAAAERLFSGESYYLPSQLAGPHELGRTDVLYPPTAMWFYLPLMVVGYPGLLVLWLAVMVWAVRGCKPWAWPLIALCIAPWQTLLALNDGNPSMLVAIGVALALRFAAFGPLALLKPSFFMFGLVGIRSKWWWVTSGLLLVATLPFISETLLYPRVVLDTVFEQGLMYSFWTYSLALIPVIAWFARDRRPVADPHPVSAP
jgi:hypothetical protein